MTDFCRTPAYFAKFSCIGPDCPSTCCQAWGIVIDKPHYKSLKKSMSKRSPEAELFSRYVVINDSKDGSKFARMNMRDNDLCPMLDSDGLCLIHRNYGIEKLWDVCTMYPRVVTKNSDHYEMSGALSCPEVTRLCLEDETPLKTVNYPTSDLPRQRNFPLYQAVPKNIEDAYTKHFSRVRDTLMLIMGKEDEELEARLYHLATLASQIAPFYFRGCSMPDRQPLSPILQDSLSLEERQRCRDTINQYQADESLAISLALPILQLLQQQDANLEISRLFDTIKKNHPEAMVEEFLDAEYFRHIINQRQKTLKGPMLERIDRGIGRYVLNCLHREWFTSMPNLQNYLQLLLVRTAILRFLLLLHPEVSQIESEGAADKLLVTVFTHFCRNIDQSKELLLIIYNALNDQKLLGYQSAPGFIRLSA